MYYLISGGADNEVIAEVQGLGEKVDVEEDLQEMRILQADNHLLIEGLLNQMQTD